MTGVQTCALPILQHQIIETNTITSWKDPALWVTIITALIMLYTVRKMSEQNEISANSVNEMKKQYEDNVYQKDTEIYRKYALQAVEECENFINKYTGNNIANHVIVILKNLATHIRRCLFELSFRSVYREELQKLLQKLDCYIDNFDKTNPKEIISFVDEIITTFTKIQDYIKPESE